MTGISDANRKRLDEISTRISQLSAAYETATGSLRSKKETLNKKLSDKIISDLDYFNDLANLQAGYNLDPSVKEYNDLRNEAYGIEVSSPGFIWRLRKNLMSIASLTAYPVTSYPGYNEWGGEDGWFGFKATRKSLNEESSKSSTGASTDVSFMGIVPLGKASADISSDLQKKFTSAATISFELKRIFLSRFWLDEEAISDEAFVSNTGKPPLLSTGKFNSAGWYGEEDRKPGVTRHEYALPLIPAEVILIRKLSIIFESKDAAKEFQKGTVGGSGGWGIMGFRIGGSANHSWERSSSKLEQKGNEITATGMSIIGFICHKVPAFPREDMLKSPKP